MVDAILIVVVVLGLVAAPLAWRAAVDRRLDEAQALEARVKAAARRALGGDSLLSVHVEPRSAMHTGRIMLSTPSGWECLIEPVWKPALDATPDGYELVVTPSRVTRAA